MICLKYIRPTFADSLQKLRFFKNFLIYPESVKLKLQNKAKRLINTAFLSKTSIIEFAPNGCRKSHMIKCLNHLISCGIQAFFNNRISRIQVYFFLSCFVFLLCLEYIRATFATSLQKSGCFQIFSFFIFDSIDFCCGTML